VSVSTDKKTGRRQSVSVSTLTEDGADTECECEHSYRGDKRTGRRQSVSVSTDKRTEAHERDHEQVQSTQQ
jgi:hypothetical protein